MGSGLGHALITRLDELASRPGHQLIYSVGRDFSRRERQAITAVPQQAWQIAIGPADQSRERRMWPNWPGCWTRLA